MLALVTHVPACAGRTAPAVLADATSPRDTSVGSSSAPLVSSKATPTAVPVFRETGIAAWYGLDYQGRKTASGEVFDMNGLSAAHRTLPLGTTLRVTNLDNSKSITVRITDRGPLVKSRILDLSYAAAKELEFIPQGTARVMIETQEPLRNGALYTVQAALFSEEENARMLKDRLTRRFEQVSIIPLETNVARLYRVRVGSYSSPERAEQVAAKLTMEGLEPIVLRKD